MIHIFNYIIQHWISIVAALVGIIYLILEYKASSWMWPISIISALFYTYIYFSNQLYASMSINIYFFFASIYAWIIWIVGLKKSDGTRIAPFNKKYMIPIIISIITIAIIILGILTLSTRLLHSKQEPFYLAIGDSLTTSLNIVSLWMTGRRWAEQWLLLIPANAISCILLYIQGDSVSTGLYVIYTLASIAGFFSWQKMKLKEQL